MDLNPQNPSDLPKGRGFSQTMKWAGVVFLSGQLPLGIDGALVSDEFRSQCRKVFSNLEAALRSQGSTLQDVLRINVYLTDMGNYEAFREVRAEMLQEPFPTSTLVGVTGLAVPGALLEIEAIAAGS